MPEHHNQTFNGMPNTIEYIEQNGRYDVLEIYTRGKTPDMPVLKYANHNKNTIEKTSQVLKNKNFITKESQKNNYINAKDSILKVREENEEQIIDDCKERFAAIINSMNDRNASKSEKEQLLELLELYNNTNEKVKKKDYMNKIVDDEER